MTTGARPLQMGETRSGAVTPPALSELQKLLFNRELSWLEFNRRVLEEARDSTQPLLERLKFLSIFSTNLDEFFMVRVSGLMEELEEQVTQVSPDGLTPAEQLQAISERLRPMVEEQSRCLAEEVLPQLAAQGVVVESYRDLNQDEQCEADRYFDERVFPVLTPQAVDPSHPFPYISNLSLNIGVMVEPRHNGDAEAGPAVKTGRRFARVKIPPVVPHLVPVDKAGRKFVFIGSLIAANIGALFPEMRTGKCHLFRVTRDADFDMARRAASTSAFADSTRSLYCMKLRPASVTLCSLYSSLSACAAVSEFLPETDCWIGVSTRVAALSVCAAAIDGACRRIDLPTSKNRPTTAQITRTAARIP